jgi:hypothetical protein
MHHEVNESPPLPGPRSSGKGQTHGERLRLPASKLAAPQDVSQSNRPSIVRGQWFEGRFVYWRGLSGQRYLFSEVSAEELQDLENAIILIPADDQSRAPGYVGEALPDAMRARAKSAYVHLLAASESERRRVVEDLSPLAA